LVARIQRARDTTCCVRLYGVRVQALNEQTWRLKFLSGCIVVSLFGSAIYIEMDPGSQAVAIRFGP